jgi:putative NIF3 family GTP cyclohydrolase 1 type 2
MLRNNRFLQHQALSHDVSKRESEKTGEDKVLRIEMQIRKNEVGGVLKKIKQHREFGRVPYDVYPLLPTDPQEGLGRIGDLSKGSDLVAFARQIKRKLDLPSVKIAGDPDLPVYSVAVCSGSGSSLLNAFLASRAQIYVTGDLRYHDARTAEAAGRGLIDIGHFASEHLMVEVLVDMLRRRMTDAGFDVRVMASGLEKDPFVII